MGRIEYHQEELKIALDRGDERRVLPEILNSDRVILDIGCGIGQSFMALDTTNRICIGLDVDEDAVRYGIEHHGHKVQFILADAAHIPLPSNTLNLVFSRVSLPYTNIPKVVKEIRRVLQSDGRVWMTLHGKQMTDRQLREALRAGNMKQLVRAIYTLANGYLLKHLGIVVPFITGRFESWQDISAMKSLLIKNGFEVDVFETGGHTVVQGKLSGHK